MLPLGSRLLVHVLPLPIPQRNHRLLCLALLHLSLSYRDIEKMMLYRGIEVTSESIREWCQKFGQQYANQLRRKRPYISDKWHLDEVVVTIKKQQSGLTQETFEPKDA